MEKKSQVDQEPVLLPILLFFGIFAVMLIALAPRDTRIEPRSTPVAIAQVPQQPLAQPTPRDHLELMASGLETVLASDVRAGGRLYGSVCSACHGINLQGISGLGKPLINSQFVNRLNDDELVAFLVVGRSTRDPLNTTGIAMPAKGGNPSLTEANLHQIVDYIRSFNGATVIDDLADQPEIVYEMREFVPIDTSALVGVVVPPSHGASGSIELHNLDGQRAYIWSCSACHGIDGAGVPTMPNTSLIGVTLNQDELFVMFTTSAPVAYSPTFTHALRGGYPPLSDDQLQALFDYLSQLTNG